MNFFLYTLLCVFYFISKILGIRFSSFLGGIVMYTYGYFSKKNLIGMRNLEIVFPKKTIKEKKNYSQKNVVSFWKSYW